MWCCSISPGDSSVPVRIVLSEVWLPGIRAAVALLRNDPSRAIELLQTASDIESSVLPVTRPESGRLGSPVFLERSMSDSAIWHK
jgi:hypothetical protein